MDHRSPHQPAGLLRVLALRVVQDGSAQSANVFEKRWAGDSPVVDAHAACSGVGGELLCVAVPRRPGRLVGVHQHQRVFRLDRRRLRADTQRIKPIHPDEVGVEGERREIGCLHPADREVEASVGDAGGLRVRRHDPSVDAHLRHSGGPFRPVGGTPVHVADPDRFGCHQTGRAPAQLVGLSYQCAGMWQQGCAAGGQGDGAAVAVEQADLQVAFERLDLLGQRRTRDVQPLGRATEVQLLGDGHEVAQLAQLHSASVVQ
jgi:hypothetical protein